MGHELRAIAFATWAPPGAAWTNWAKPVLFANLPADSQVSEVLAEQETDLPPADGKTSLVWRCATASIGWLNRFQQRV